MNRKWVYWQTCILSILVGVFSARATTIVMPNDDQLIAKTPLIVRGEVIATGAVERNGGIWTETTVQVFDTLKGKAAAETVTIREVGGQIGDHVTVVFGSPHYEIGEEVLAFLTPTPRGDYQTMDLFVGKFTAERLKNGTRAWGRDERALNTTLLDHDLKPITGAKVSRDADLFESYIRARVKGAPAQRNYGIDESDTTTTTSDGSTIVGATAPFTMISEPAIYRWKQFDTGTAAQWYSYGTQPGYTGGGVNELRTAMGAWTGYSAAKILYSYVGTESSAPGGLSSPNGVNEVLFNDPKGEISGSWNPSTGGVVGQGGFNGVTYGGSWTSPFAADATHVQKTYNTTAITEGNLVIQDNVSPGNGLSSATLAEIVAHEFGHTLGFGHSSENPNETDTTLKSALMYYRVTGLGASLRADDQLAARWLYPSGSGGGTTPAPVSSFSFSPASPTTATNIAFTDQSSGSPTSWSWNFGDGTTSTAQNPSKRFTSAGSYNVTLTASNSGGSSSTSRTVSVAPATVSVAAAFSYSPTSPTTSTTISFIDQSSGSPTSWSWNFGDGTTSTAQNPTKRFTTAGTYTVTLTAANSSSSSKASRTVTVAAAAVNVAAAFSFSPTAPTAGATVYFTDQSTGSPNSWNWNFGDGTGSGAQNPSKQYSAAGSYTVTLTVSNGSSSSSTSRSVSVGAGTPATPPVVASFTTSVTTAATNQAVTFYDRSSGAPTSWSWNFGDGASSTAQNPSHAYAAAGSYTVTLTARNSASSSTSTGSMTITSSAQAFRSLVPVTAQTPGVGGSNWRTELTIFNAGTASVTVQLLYLPGAGGAIQSRTASVGGRQTLEYNNALPDLFGISNGAGAIAIEATSNAGTPDLKVASRTYTGSSSGTYGQFVPDERAAQVPQTMYLTALENDTNYRTNIGIVNKSASPASAAITLYRADGTVLGTVNVSAAASSFQQTPITTLFPAIAGQQLSSMSMKIVASVSNAINTYASVADNRSQDPIYIPSAPVRSGYELIVPAVGRTSGSNGTYWRSDVTLFNPTGSTLSVSLGYLAAGTANTAPITKTVSVAPSRTVTIADISTWLGVGDGSGALQVTWSGSTTAPVVGSRTYTTRWDGGTYGQSIDPTQSFGSLRYVTGLRSDASYRSNVGFVNNSYATIGVNVSLVNSSGQAVATAFVQVPARSAQQASVKNLFPNTNVASLGVFTMQAQTDTAPALFAYGSVADNVSGDPIFISGE